jgi:hypothetical protein
MEHNLIEKRNQVHLAEKLVCHSMLQIRQFPKLRVSPGFEIMAGSEAVLGGEVKKPWTYRDSIMQTGTKRECKKNCIGELWIGEHG